MDDKETSCIDQMSELPDFILHHILSYLSTKQAVQTGVISKRWKYVWETFPILECFQGHFGKHLNLINPKEQELPKDERRKIFNQRLNFMSYIDKKLLRFHEEKLCVNKFNLHIILVSKVLAPRVDRWMELVAKRRIQELNLYIFTGKGRVHDLSKILFTMESLTVLHLFGSIMLRSPPDSKAVKLCSLVELHLRSVSIDENTIQDLIRSIKSLKVFSLCYCLGFENLDICGHDKLEKMVYRNFKANRFRIEVQTLKELTLDFCSGSKETMVCEIIVSSVCQNLTRLSLWVTPIDAKWLQRLITSFPLLEHLYLGGCMLQEVIKLSSQSLKEICFKDCMKLVEAEFDAPKLQSFKYGGETIPRFYLNSVADYRTAEFSALFQHMDSLWFMRLYDILRYFKIQDLTFEIYSIGEDISFNAEDYTGKQFPLFELNNMKLVMFLFETTSTINYISLLDGLFWNLRPRILSFFKLYCLSPQNLKGLLKCLVAEEPNCYCSQNLDCWRHSLKDIKLITVKGWESDTVFNAMTLNDLTNYLDDWVIEAKEPLKYPVKNPLNCHGAKLFRLFYVVSVPVPKALCQPVLLPS